MYNPYDECETLYQVIVQLDNDLIFRPPGEHRDIGMRAMARMEELIEVFRDEIAYCANDYPELGFPGLVKACEEFTKN